MSDGTLECQDGIYRNFRLNDDVLNNWLAKLHLLTSNYEDEVAFIYDLYQLGEECGQEFIGKVRSGNFEGSSGVPGTWTKTVTWNDGEILEYEFKDGQLRRIN